MALEEPLAAASDVDAHPRTSTGSRRERKPSTAVSTYELTRELEELIAALDRRVRRVEQAGEADIARDAAALRAKAVDRLKALASPPAVAASKDGGDAP